MNFDLSFPVVVEGFLLGFSLIVPIGTQNTYVLRQGALGKHPQAASVVCSLCDTILILIGAMGIGTLIAKSLLLRQVAVAAGVLFLAFYGAKSLRRAFKSDAGSEIEDPSSDASSLKMVVASALAFSLLNPHAILDTTVLIGGIAAQKTALCDRVSFSIGAVAASWAWFISLGYFARLLRPLFQKAMAARLLDGLVAVLMFTVAGMLLYSEMK